MSALGVHFLLEGGVGGHHFVDGVGSGGEVLNFGHGEGVFADLDEVGIVIAGGLGGCGVEGGGEGEDGERGGKNAEMVSWAWTPWVRIGIMPEE